MTDFLAGLYVAFSLVAIVFFLRFWRETTDILFLRFALALLILTGERIFLTIIPVEHEAKSLIYLMRFFAFAMIIWAMIDKNRPHKSETSKSK